MLDMRLWIYWKWIPNTWGEVCLQSWWGDVHDEEAKYGERYEPFNSILSFFFSPIDPKIPSLLTKNIFYPVFFRHSSCQQPITNLSSKEPWTWILG